MIDIENAIFSKVKSAVTEVFTKAFVESTYVDRVSSFPCVSLVESDNIDTVDTIEITGDVQHNTLTYDCNIYTTGDSKKSEAKQLADIVDTAMAKMGFRRTMRSQIPNVERTIYRITMRFVGKVAQGVQDGDNVFYKIYKQ